jgi:hypothetical protein
MGVWACAYVCKVSLTQWIIPWPTVSTETAGNCFISKTWSLKILTSANKHVHVTNCIWLNERNERHSHQLFLTRGIGHPVLSDCGLFQVQARWGRSSQLHCIGNISKKILCISPNICSKLSLVVTHFKWGICLIAPPLGTDAQSPRCLAWQFLSLALFSFC